MDVISAEAQHAPWATGAAASDVDQVTEQIWCELDGKVSRETIQQVVSVVAARYRDAQGSTYVPIFVRRDALRQLTGRK